MKIRMTQSIPGSLDGVTVIDLVEGQEYDTIDSARGERLALAHIRKGVAVAVDGVDVPVTAGAPDPGPVASAPKARAKRTAAK